MSSIGSILASQALKIIYLTKWIFGLPLYVQDKSRLYFHRKTCLLGHQENSIDDNFVPYSSSFPLSLAIVHVLMFVQVLVLVLKAKQ